MDACALVRNEVLLTPDQAKARENSMNRKRKAYQKAHGTDIPPSTPFAEEMFRVMGPKGPVKVQRIAPVSSRDGAGAIASPAPVRAPSSTA